MTRDDGYTRYTLRIPTPLYERVKAAAGEASVNAEILATLEQKYPPPLTADLRAVLDRYHAVSVALTKADLPQHDRQVLSDEQARLYLQAIAMSK